MIRGEVEVMDLIHVEFGLTMHYLSEHPCIDLGRVTVFVARAKFCSKWRLEADSKDRRESPVHLQCWIS